MALSQSGRESENEHHRVLLFLALSCSTFFFSSVVNEDTEGMFVSFDDGPKMRGIAYLIDKSRFQIKKRN